MCCVLVWSTLCLILFFNLNSVVLISAVQWSDSVMYVYTFFFIFSLHYGLSQDIEYSSLCFTVGPCCLSLIYKVLCICQMSFSISSSLNGASSRLVMNHDVSRGHGVSWGEGPGEALGAEGAGSGSHPCHWPQGCPSSEPCWHPGLCRSSCIKAALTGHVR